MIEYIIVPTHAVLDHIKRKSPDHFLKMKEKKFRDSANVDWDYYKSISLSGNSLAIVALKGKEIIGYSVFTVTSDPIHKEFLQAANDAFFVEEKYRNKISMKFLKKTNQLLKESGVNNISYILSDEKLGRVLSMSGYKPTHTVWSFENE